MYKITQLSKMLHNKYYEILENFLGDYNKEIYGRELVDKVKMSQKSIALVLSDLEKKNILKSKKRGNMRYFKLNLDNSEIKEIILSLEIMRKINFLKKHRKLIDVFSGEIVGIFGSYVRGENRKDSDIDVFVVGDKKNFKMDNKFNLDISVKYFSLKDFKSKGNLVKEIVSNHVLISGFEKFIDILWEKYYGFD